MKPQDVIDEARSWVGTPFRHQGRVKGLGVDCIGVIAMVGKALGLTDYDKTDYGRQPYKGLLKKGIEPHLEQVQEIHPGYILLMKFADEPQHVAIYTENNTIIHSYQKVNKCTEHRFANSWKNMVVGIYRFKGVEWLR